MIVIKIFEFLFNVIFETMVTAGQNRHIQEMKK